MDHRGCSGATLAGRACANVGDHDCHGAIDDVTGRHDRRPQFPPPPAHAERRRPLRRSRRTPIDGDDRPGDGTGDTANHAGHRSSSRHQRAPTRRRAGAGLMSISALFIRRPVMTLLLMTGILVFGIVVVPPLADQRSADRRLSHDHA